MKHINSVLFAFVLLAAAVTDTLGAEGEERLSVVVQFIQAEGSASSSSVSKTAGGGATFPLELPQGQKWIVFVQKRPSENTFAIRIEDPTLLSRGADNAPTSPVTILSTVLDVTNGKPITVLKTDQYSVDVTLTVE
jgi:hypothetical protein